MRVEDDARIYREDDPLSEVEDVLARRAVEDELSGDALLRTADIRVAVTDKVVVLRGTVRTEMQRRRAEALASSVPNVIGVQNELNVVS